jgi:small conductance mechanosensitive channel
MLRSFLLQIQKDSVVHDVSSKLYNWTLTTGPRIVLAVILFFIAQWVIKLINKAFNRILSNKRFDSTLRPFLENLVQIALQVLLILGLMQLLGIQMTLFAAVLGAFGVAVGLALSGTLQNFASGILIILLKPFKVGDNIRTQNEEGTVTSIRLFNSVIQTFTNTTLIVPNGKLCNEVIFNLTLLKKRRIDTLMKFSFKTEYKKVESLIKQAVEQTTSVLKDPEYRIGVEKIEGDSYTVILNAWVNAHGYEDAKLELNARLLEQLTSMMDKKEDEKT